jgi:flotillin
LTSLTNALAAQQLANPAEPPAVLDAEADEVVTPPATISGPGKATLGPKT